MEQRKNGLTLSTRMMGVKSAQSYLSEEVDWQLSDWASYINDVRERKNKKGMDWYVETRKFIKMLKL